MVFEHARKYTNFTFYSGFHPLVGNQQYISDILKEVYKIKYKNILLIVLLLCLIFSLNGCGGECKESSDCPSKTCFIAECMDKKCVETPKEDCCSNGICDVKGGETKCSCQKDCGQCSGKVGMYLEYMCDGDNCITYIKDDVIKKTSFTDKISLRNIGDISATYTYDQPFNIDESLFNIRFVLDNKQNDIEYIKINKVNIYEELGKRTAQVQTYGEKIVDLILWDSRTDVIDDVILSLNMSNKTEEEKQLTVDVIYEYAKLVKGTTTTTSGTYKKQIKDKLIFVNPSKKAKCPSSCDDNNPCTTDRCSAATNYFCEHIIKEGVSCCGNHKCDSGEDKCSCQRDCGYCEKEFGSYIEFVCIGNKCSSRLKTEQVPKTLIEDGNMNDIRIEMKTTFKEPFDIGIDKYKIELELQYKADGVSNIKCNKFQVLSGDELLAEKDIIATFTSLGGSYSIEFGTSFSMKEVEESKGTNMELTCSYSKTTTSGTQSYIKSVTQSLGMITYVNPDV